jgi:hypothetical protein
MVGARLEYCAKWQQMASAQESNNQMAIGGSRRPTEKIVARQLTAPAGQKKHSSAAIGDNAGLKKNARHGNRVSRRPLGKSRHGNRWIAPASWKIASRQLVDRASHLKIRSTAIKASRRPLKLSRRGNRGIAPA